MTNREEMMYQLGVLDDERFWKVMNFSVCPSCVYCMPCIKEKCVNGDKPLCLTKNGAAWLREEYSPSNGLLFRNLDIEIEE